MKQLRKGCWIAMTLGLVIGLFSCASSERKDTPEEVGWVDSVTSMPIVVKEVEKPDCTRERATPIIRKEYCPNTTFELQSDSLTGIEKVAFDNGDGLIIRNWGCEELVLTFRFETSRFERDTADLRYWYQVTGQLLTRMLACIDGPIDIKRALVFLESYRLRDGRNGFKNLKIGDRIDFDEHGMRRSVTLNRIESMEDGKFGVTVSFTQRPL